MATGTNNKRIKPASLPGYHSGHTSAKKVLKRPPEEFAMSIAEVHAEIEKWELLNRKLCAKWWRFNQYLTTREELYQIMVQGWLYAGTVFDKRRKTRFSSYASGWGEAYIRRFLIQEANRGFRTPGMYERLVRLPRPVSADQGFGPTDFKFRDTIAARKSDEEPEFPDDFWYRVYKFLDPLKRKVIEMRYQRGMILEEIGKELGMTRARAGQIEDLALERIRKFAKLESVVENL